MPPRIAGAGLPAVGVYKRFRAAVSEGFCNAVMEAQAVGLPVVCTDADGLLENVRDGETGFVVPRRNPRALANKLTALADDAALRQKFSHAGRH